MSFTFAKNCSSGKVSKLWKRMMSWAQMTHRWTLTQLYSSMRMFDEEGDEIFPAQTQQASISSCNKHIFSSG